MSIFDLLLQSVPVLLAGALLTIKFAVLSMLFGLAAAMLVTLMGISTYPALQRVARSYVSIMRGTPLLVQIFVVYYGLPSLGLSLGPTTAGVLALSANVAAYLSESMRGAILGIDRGQWLAAYRATA
jgi:cystine transport system permease protein